MSYLIVADLHGSRRGMNLLEEAVAREKPDVILLLGDILRGSGDEDSGYVSLKLTSLPIGFLPIKGNCDYPSDRYSLNMDLPISRVIPAYGFEIHMQHYPFASSLYGKKIFLHGHTHRKILYKNEDGGILCCPGSIALPRDGSASYGVLDPSGIRLMSALDGTILDSVSL